MSDEKNKKTQDVAQVSFAVQDFKAFCGEFRGVPLMSGVNVSVIVSGVPPEDACAIFDSVIETLRPPETWEVAEGGGPEVGKPKGWGTPPAEG